MRLNKVNIVPIGNSKGIRIPKVIMEQCHIKKSVDLEIDNDMIIIMAHSEKPRKNWEQYFEKMAKYREDNLLINDNLDIHNDEWIW